MDSVRFNYGDLVLVDSKMHHADCNVGYIINPKSGSRLYNGIILFGSNEIWWFKNQEIELIKSALTTKTSEGIL